MCVRSHTTHSTHYKCDPLIGANLHLSSDYRSSLVQLHSIAVIANWLLHQPVTCHPTDARTEPSLNLGDTIIPTNWPHSVT